LQLLLYLSPIIYPLSYVPAKYQSLFLLNPMAVIITQSQAILITGQVIDWWLLGYTLMLAIVVLIVGRIFFQGQIKRVNDNF